MEDMEEDVYSCASLSAESPFNVSLQSSMLDNDVAAQQNWDDKTVWDVFCMLQAHWKNHRCGVRVSQVLQSQERKCSTV